MAWKLGWEFLDSPPPQQGFAGVSFAAFLSNTRWSMIDCTFERQPDAEAREGDQDGWKMIHRAFPVPSWLWLLWGSSGPEHNSWAQCLGNVSIQAVLFGRSNSRECPKFWVQESKSCGVSIGLNRIPPTLYIGALGTRLVLQALIQSQVKMMLSFAPWRHLVRSLNWMWTS